MRTFIAAALLFLAPAWTLAQELPEDLARVPGNAIGFVHVRVAELTKSPAFKLYRDVFAKAGADAVAAIEERIVPSPLSIDRVTVVVLPPSPQLNGPEVAALIHSQKPIDEKKITANFEKVVTDQKRIGYRFGRDGVFQLIGSNTLLIGTPGCLDLMAEGGKMPPSLKKGLVVAAEGKKAIVAAGNTSLLPPGALAQLPPPAQPFAKATSVLASLDIGKRVVLDVDLGFAEADHAKDAERTLEELRRMGKAFLKQTEGEMERKLATDRRIVPIFDVEKVAEIVGPVYALGLIRRGQEILGEIPVTRDQDRINVKITVPEELGDSAATAPILIGLLVPAVQKVREAATRTQDLNKLKQLGLAMHIYHDANKHFIPALCDANGKPLLSWRVAILPYIEEGALYKKFKLDEPWDSEHNKKLLLSMPKLYELAEEPGNSDGRTKFRVLVGPDAAPSALFRSYSEKTRLRDITDGTSNTIMIVEAAESVPWTKPDELAYDPKGALPRFYRRPGGGFVACFADGSVRMIGAAIPEASIRAAITRNGGEVAPID